jgi:hypothetical protein
MNPSNYSLPASVLQDMIDDDYKKEHHQYETLYTNTLKGESNADIS